MVGDSDIGLKLSILKPLHAGWISDLYGYLTSEEGGKIISNGRKAVFITNIIEKNSKSLDSLDPFYEVDPLNNEVNEMLKVVPANQDNINSFATRLIDDYEEEWKCKGEPLNNIFEILNDFE